MNFVESLRNRALAAAVDILGSQGLRALTHRRVDERAGLPAGSTSNYFRSRAALLDGVVVWVAQHELTDVDAGVAPASADDLIDEFCALLEVQTREFRSRTIARYVLFLEAARHGDSRAPLVQNRHLFEERTIAMLAGLAAPDPDAAALALMACGEGLMLHRLTVDDSIEFRPAVAMVVRACLGPGQVPPRTS